MTYTLVVKLKFPEGTTLEQVERARQAMACEADDFRIINDAQISVEIVDDR